MDDKQIAEYKKFINDLVKLLDHPPTLNSFSSEDDDHYLLRQSLEKKLNNDDIEAINSLFKRVYQNAIYRVLELLSEKQQTEELKIYHNDIELPVEPFGNELASDWISICEGEKWPDEMSCNVHNILLQYQEVPIIYGLIRYPTEFYQLREKDFPFANFFVEGGCFSSSNKSQRVSFCVKCRESLISWNRENNLKYGLP